MDKSHDSSKTQYDNTLPGSSTESKSTGEINSVENQSQVNEDSSESYGSQINMNDKRSEISNEEPRMAGPFIPVPMPTLYHSPLFCMSSPICRKYTCMSDPIKADEKGEMRTSELEESFCKAISESRSLLDTISSNYKQSIMDWFDHFATLLKHEQLECLMNNYNRSRFETEHMKKSINQLQKLVSTYQNESQSKTKAIYKCLLILEKQREKFQLQKNFHSWQLNSVLQKHERSSTKFANFYYNNKLKRKSFLALHSDVHQLWQERVSSSYQRKLQEACSKLKEAHSAEVAKLSKELTHLKNERRGLLSAKEECETSMQQALMRGLCTLNLEALNVLHQGNSSNSSFPDVHQSSSSYGHIFDNKSTIPGKSLSLTSPQSPKVVIILPQYTVDEKSPVAARTNNLLKHQTEGGDTYIYSSAGMPSQNKFGLSTQLSDTLVTSNKVKNIAKATSFTTKIPKQVVGRSKISK